MHKEKSSVGGTSNHKEESSVLGGGGESKGKETVNVVFIIWCKVTLERFVSFWDVFLGDWDGQN